MKSNFYKYLLIIFVSLFSQNSYGKEFNINALNVEVDKENKTVYAKGEVEIYDKLKNIIFSDEAEYDKLKGIVKTKGPTKVLTSEKYPSYQYNTIS